MSKEPEAKKLNIGQVARGLTLVGLTILSAASVENLITVRTLVKADQGYRANSQTRLLDYSGEEPPSTIGQVTMRDVDSGKTFRCTGIATTRENVRTADHCIPEDVLMGRFKPWNSERVHPAWVASRDPQRDRAELRLSVPLEDIPQNQFIPDGLAEVNSEGVIFGFCPQRSVNVGRAFRKVLSDGPMLVRDLVGDRLTNAAPWVAENAEENTCLGDSGAPVLQKDRDGKWRNVGMVVNTNRSSTIVVPSVEIGNTK